MTENVKKWHQEIARNCEEIARKCWTIVGNLEEKKAENGNANENLQEWKVGPKSRVRPQNKLGISKP